MPTISSCMLVVLVGFMAMAMAVSSAQAQKPRACDSALYCYSTSDHSLLHSVQMMRLFKDSKTFVDMPTKVSEAQVFADFNALGTNFTKEQLEKFVSDHFWEAGHEVVNVEPTDWSENPRYFSYIQDPQLKEFAKMLNLKWKHLLRKFDKSKICAECSSSAILTNSSFIVPGGRFIEYYYWDTYWAILGLLSSDMTETVKSVITNFLEIIETNGFVPNGARIYYLNRSQPPMLAQMVEAYFDKRIDIAFIRYAMPLLDKEYQFWMEKKAINYTTPDNQVHQLNHYYVPMDAPRPESYREDLENAKASANESLYYANVYSAAESGWDFSSRWFNDPMNISTIAITDIIPVDLNAILYKNERTLYNLHATLGNTDKADFYRNQFRKREQAINSVFWSEATQTWTDFNWKLKRPHNQYQYPTDLTPLWADVKLPNTTTLAKLMSKYRSLLTSYKSGVPSSNVHTHQQWDLPNVWAPYHDWLVSFMRTNWETLDIADDIAQRFVSTAYCGWKKSGYMYEKYNANELGGYGEGGEYVVQEGFGWTNGVVIRFMEIFGNKLKAPTAEDCNPKNHSSVANRPHSRLMQLLGFIACLIILI